MATPVKRRRWDLLIILTAPPHADDTLTTVFRLAQAILDRGRSVRIWACGYSTMLTQASLAATKPSNLRDPNREFPSASALVRRFVTEHPNRFGWVVCTVCSAERGASSHIPEVHPRSAARMAATMAAADRTLYVGGA